MGLQKNVARDDDRKPIEPRSDSGSLVRGLLEQEDAVGRLHEWMARGLRGVLVTLVGVEGGAPRHVGAQMAVCEDGRYAGYLSGGCLEQAVVLEALAVLKNGRNRMVRYGKNSPYLDIRLPCGSGLDLYFDQGLNQDQLGELEVQRRLRRPVLLRTDLAAGVSRVLAAAHHVPVGASARIEDAFERVYPPALRLVLAGGGPGLIAIAALARALGIELRVATMDAAMRDSVATSAGLSQVETDSLEASIQDLDFATAVVLVFHEHHNELDVLEKVLATRCFYVGALGNHAVHRERLRELRLRGLPDSELERIRAPVGTIAGAKSGATLAVGVLTELMAEAKAQNLVA